MLNTTNRRRLKALACIFGAAHFPSSRFDPSRSISRGKQNLFKSLAVLFSVFLAAGLSARVNWALPRSWVAEIFETQDPPSASSNQMENNPPPTHVRVSQGISRNFGDSFPKLFEVERSMHNVRVLFGNGFQSIDPDIGGLPNASRRTNARAIDDTGKELYNVTYGVDEWHRRVTPNPGKGRRDRALLFLGCSYTFGEGLEDEDTLPAAVARKTDQFRIYNYSFHGWGLGNVLRRVEKKSFTSEIPEKGDTAIYVFIDNHMHRAVGSFSLSRLLPEWRSILPYYFLDDQGALQSKGMLSDGKPWESWFFLWLARSSLVETRQIDFPLRFGERHFELFTAMLQRLRTTLHDKKQINKFYVLIYPGSSLGKYLIPYLDRAGIMSIDYSNYRVPLIPGENIHPTKQAQEFIAERLVSDLKLR